MNYGNIQGNLNYGAMANSSPQHYNPALNPSGQPLNPQSMYNQISSGQMPLNNPNNPHSMSLNNQNTGLNLNSLQHQNPNAMLNQGGLNTGMPNGPSIGMTTSSIT